MATDYEQFYRENPHGLGEPTREFVTFFETYQRPEANVLDVGCGQGRDTLFVARLGHKVMAVDHSTTGIQQLQVDAEKENLKITTEVADVREVEWRGPFDVIIVDRTLHMLAPEDRIQVLSRLLGATRAGSNVLIADERRNLSKFKAVLDASKWNWEPTLERRGYLFIVRE